MLSRYALASSAVAVALTFVAAPSAVNAQTFVTDLTAIARAETEISHQISQIAQLKDQLTNQALMLQSLKTDITGPIREITGKATQILKDAQGLAYGAQDVTQQFKNIYPANMAGLSLTDTQQALSTWRDNNAQALQQALQLQNQIVQTQPDTADKVAEAITASQGAAGQTAAVQATNQLLATVSGQLTQLQNLLITQARAEQTLAAQAAASQAAGAADSQRFWNTTAPASRVTDPGSL